MPGGPFFPPTLFPWLTRRRQSADCVKQSPVDVPSIALRAGVARRRVAMAEAGEAGAWQEAAFAAAELCDLLLLTGHWREVLVVAEQGKEWLKRQADPLTRLYLHAQMGMAQHRLGALRESHLRFQEAEQWQAERKTGYHWLIGLPGKGYCDLIMEQAQEEGAWERVLHRSHYSQKISKNLLTIALDLQTQGRALAALGQQETARATFHQAVITLRKANNRAYMPEVLLHQAGFLWRQGADSTDLSPLLEEALQGAISEGLKPAEADGRLLEAHLLLDAGRLEAAETAWIALETLVAELEYGQRMAELCLLRARLLRQQGNPTEAEQWRVRGKAQMERQAQWGVERLWTKSCSSTTERR